jgi:hypothetical protein
MASTMTESMWVGILQHLKSSGEMSALCLTNIKIQTIVERHTFTFFRGLNDFLAYAYSDDQCLKLIQKKYEDYAFEFIDSDILIKCIDFGYVQTVCWMVKTAMYVDVEKVLKRAVERGSATVTAALLSDGMDCRELLELACEHGHVEIVRLLLKNKHLDPSQSYALGEACEHGQLEIVRLLLEDGRVAAEEDDNDAIRTAAKCGHLEIVQILVEFILNK